MNSFGYVYIHKHICINLKVFHVGITFVSECDRKKVFHSSSAFNYCFTLPGD